VKIIIFSLEKRWSGTEIGFRVGGGINHRGGKEERRDSGKAERSARRGGVILGGAGIPTSSTGFEIQTGASH